MPTFEIVIRDWISRLRPTATVVVTLDSASTEVSNALVDASVLGAPRAVDRVHTAMHSYLHQICDEAGLSDVGATPTMARLLKVIKQQHPAFSELGPREEHVARVLQAMGTILDALNPLRNHHSAAHPLNQLLDEPEANLVCNTVRTLLAYLDARLYAARTAAS